MSLISERLRGMRTPIRITLTTKSRAAESATAPSAPDAAPPASASKSCSSQLGPSKSGGGYFQARITQHGYGPTPAVPPVPDTSAWTIPLICFGVAIIACCVLIPAADENRRLAFERERLRQDLADIHKQIDVNDRFLARVADDPTLLQRLAQRQMGLLRQGTRELELPAVPGPGSERQMSPYLLLNLPPPEPVAPYRPIGGVFSALCRETRPRLIMMGTALLLIAAGLILEAAPQPESLRSRR
jgi:hypothetical protein